MTIVRFGTFDFTVTAIEADAWALRLVNVGSGPEIMSSTGGGAHARFRPTVQRAMACNGLATFRRKIKFFGKPGGAGI